MSILAAIRKAGKKGRLKTLLGASLLTLYIVGTAGFEGLHQLFHAHKFSVSHSQTEEKNPCHRTIYHQDAEEGCGHANHVVVTDKCDLCDVILHADHALLVDISEQPVRFFAIDVLFDSAPAIAHAQSNLSPRAPPAI